MKQTRRRFLAASAGTLAIAGCVSDGGDGGDDAGSDDDGDDEADVEGWQRIDGAILSSSFPMELTEPASSDRLSEIHWHSDYAHWHKMPLEVPLDGWRTAEMHLLNRDLEPIPVGEDEQHHIEVRRTEDTPADLVDIGVSGEVLDIYGETEGTGELVFQVLSDGEVVFTTPALMIEVSAEFR